MTTEQRIEEIADKWNNIYPRIRERYIVERCDLISALTELATELSAEHRSFSHEPDP